MTTRFDDVPSLLAELTIEEKASLVSGAGFWWTRKVERLGIPSVMVSDGPHGLRRQDAGGDHVGLGGSRPATCFPTASALASSWDVDLVRRVGVALGEEARAQGVGVVLGPGINIKRSSLCGRNFEYFSEDPVLAGELGVAMVDGIQSQGVGTSLKHYAVNNQETDRLRVSADVDERPLRELYLSGFERVVKAARPWTVMCSYNRINGVYASQDPWLLTEVLRGEWGFDGLVVSDWGAVDDPVAAVAAGLDLEMPATGGTSAGRIVDAVKAGDLDEAVLDTAIARLLRLLERAMPGVDAGGDFDVDDHHALARAAAADCAVLLKNEGALLPLALGEGRLVVLGELARTPRFQGAGSSKVNPTKVDDALSALQAGVGPGVVVDFAPAYGVDDPEADREALRAEAVDIARDAGTVVLFLGLPPSYESEGFDRTDLDLPEDQVTLLEAVAAVNDRVIVVLANGSVVRLSAWEHHAGALLEGWLGGQAGGSAVVDVLLGTVNPSGRLAETIPLRLADTPAHLNFPGEDRHVRYGEGLHVGYRHYYAVGRAVSYSFGHGLSYTTFAWSDLAVTALDRSSPGATDDWRGAPAVAVEVTVTNTGEARGSEVVQVYVGDPESALARPVRELKAFAKVALAPGESSTVAFTLTERDLSYWSTRAGDWVLEPGAFEVSVGASSRDLRLRAVVEVDGPPLALPLDTDSTLGEWLDHPVGHNVLLDLLRRNPGGDLTPMLDDPGRRRMLASFPMRRLAGMLGPGLGDELSAALGVVSDG
ncbi:glycoside hydrolase family 3 C-terminal domain-containing protein [soil metagenome]